jgi:hypothetical protein
MNGSMDDKIREVDDDEKKKNTLAFLCHERDRSKDYAPECQR